MDRLRNFEIGWRRSEINEQEKENRGKDKLALEQS